MTDRDYREKTTVRPRTTQVFIHSEMEDLNKGTTSHKGKKLQTYSLELKREAIKYAEMHGNRPASRLFRVDEKRIREWRSKKTEIETLVATTNGKQRKKLAGGGRKPMSTKLEEHLLEWITSRYSQGLQVSCKLIMKKAETIFRDIKGSNNVDNENFKASKGWLNRFAERNNLSLRKQNSFPKKDLGGLVTKLVSCNSSKQGSEEAQHCYNVCETVAMDEISEQFDMTPETTADTSGEKTNTIIKQS